MVWKQRDNCNTVINAVSIALGVNFTNNFFFYQANLLRMLTLFKQQLNRIAHYSCKKNLRTMIIISTLQAVSICSDMRKSW